MIFLLFKRHFFYQTLKRVPSANKLTPESPQDGGFQKSGERVGLLFGLVICFLAYEPKQGATIALW